MIKLKKIVAVALTAAMCLGMSMTAFAAQSGSNDDLWSPVRLQEYGTKDDPNTTQSVSFRQARDKDGNVVDVNRSRISEGAANSLGSEVEVANAFRDAGYDVGTGVDFIPVWTGDITFRNGIPAGGGVVVFNADEINRNNAGVDVSQNLQPGNTVYVMLETYDGSGAWEVYSAVVGPNGDFNVTIPHGGAIVVTKVMSDGSVITLNKSTGEVINRVPADNVANNNAANNNAASGTTSTSTTASAATSPKTGEF